MIELALILSLLGVLLAAFVPTFLRHLRTRKIAEAVELLASLHEGAAAYYERSRAAGQACLPESAGPFPEQPGSEPVLVDFASDPKGAPTWLALGQHSPRMLRYSYEVSVPAPGCRERARGTPAITFRAYGDLDGDGEYAQIERSAAPSHDGRQLVPRGPLRIRSRTE